MTRAIYIFGDFLYISIVIFVFLGGCYFIMKRYREDRAIIRYLTSNNRVVPAYEITVIELDRPPTVPSLNE